MAAGTQHPNSIVDLLQEDDAQIAALFERLAAETKAGHEVLHDRLVGRVCETLSIQRLAEEEVLYPAIRPADEKLVFGFLLAGLGISMRIDEIRHPGKARALRDACVLRLVEMVRSNLFERAQVLIPFVKAKVLPSQLIWLGDSYAQRKARLWTASNAVHNPRAVGRSTSPATTRKVIPLPQLRQRPPAGGAPMQ
jgi:hypothetical protein